MSDLSHDARTGTVVARIPTSTPDQVRDVVARAAAAAPAVAAATPGERRLWLVAVADAVEDARAAAELVRVADRETALGEARLTSELARCADQLRFYGDVGVEASYLRVTVDHATDTTPDLRRMQVPLGPVAVLGASNFPFAFGALGNDTGSAIAAGCPVVAKAHPAHPQTSALLATVATTALADAGAPEGAFGLVAGFEAGEALVRGPEVAAVAFTGSQRGGLAVWRLAIQRDVVIPVYAEMGTVNPVVMTTARGCSGGGGRRRLRRLLHPRRRPVLHQAGAAPRSRRVRRPRPRRGRTTERAADRLAAHRGHRRRLRIRGCRARSVPGPRCSAGCRVPRRAGPRTPRCLAVPAADLKPGSRLLEECFGPVALVAEYADHHELTEVLKALQGALAASVMSAGPEDPETPDMVGVLAPLAGRVAVDDWPTGVAFTWAQQHGGPWPATTFPSATSVGAAALDRFTRPVTWQSAPTSVLPPALQEDNPWRLPRRVDGQLMT